MSTLEKVRDTIRHEVARAEPIEEARRSLELIVETSVRVRKKDGQELITVFDENGKPRVGSDGAAEFTVQDLLAELRLKHPTLFAAAPARRPLRPDSENGKLEFLAPQPPAAPRPRDWLILDQVDEAALRESASGLEGFGAAKENLKRGMSSLTHELDAAAAAVARKLADAGDTVRATALAARDIVHTTLRDPDAPGEPVASATLRAPRVADRVPGERVAAAAAAAVAFLMAGGAIFYQLAPAPAAVEPAREAAVVTAPRAEPAATGSIQPSSASTTIPAPAAGTLRGVPEILDTATLSMQGKVVPLFGVQWSRGGGEPTDLASYLRGREVSCQPAAEDSKSYRCEVEGQDLSKVVLFNGGGRTTSTATPDLLAAEAHARSAKSGLWSKSP